MEVETAFDSYIEQVRDDWKNVGVAVAVVRGRETIYARGFGVRESGKTDAIDPDTLFQVGSTTKAFTTAALAILVEEGKIRWDEPIIESLPGFQLQDPWLTRNLTIRDTVTHRSGIAVSLYPYLAVMDSSQAIRQLRYVGSNGAFRNTFVYDNLMYAVAGQVIEAASGIAWSEFVRHRLLQPLQMSRSGASPYEFWDARQVAPTFFGSAAGGVSSTEQARDVNMAMPHALDEQGSLVVLPWRSYDNASAAGALVSSAAGMANWLTLHLNEGCFEGRKLLKKETVLELHATQNLHSGIDERLFDETPQGYAMGWWRAQYRGQTHLEHGGGMIGFPAYAALLPDMQLGVVVLSNSPKAVYGDFTLGYLFHKAIASWIFDRFLGLPPRDWSRELLSRSRRAQQGTQENEEKLTRSRLSGKPPSLPLERYAGEYEDMSGHSGLVTLCLENERLTLSFSGEGAYGASLEHWHQDLFRLRSRPGVAGVLGMQFVAFILDVAGSVAAFTAFGATFRRHARI
jgi:CubicO group peptidase (beta-lactamase class C family)